MQQKTKFSERDFFKKPFSREEIQFLLQGRPASEMFNFRSPSYKKLGIDRENLSDLDLVDLMLKEPRLIRRPVVQIDQTVHFGADVKTLSGLIEA